MTINVKKYSSVPFIVFLALYLLGNSRCESAEMPPRMERQEVGARNVKIGLHFPAGIGSRRMISVDEKNNIFYVIVHNTGEMPVKFWRGLAYQGYKDVSFEITDSKGMKTLVEREDWPMGSEPDRSVIVDAGEFMVLEICPSENDWKKLRQVPSGNITIQAIFKSDTPKDEPIGWVGVSTSRSYTVEMYNAAMP